MTTSSRRISSCSAETTIEKRKLDLKRYLLYQTWAPVLDPITCFWWSSVCAWLEVLLLWRSECTLMHYGDTLHVCLWCLLQLFWYCSRGLVESIALVSAISFYYLATVRVSSSFASSVRPPRCEQTVKTTWLPAFSYLKYTWHFLPRPLSMRQGLSLAMGHHTTPSPKDLSFSPKFVYGSKSLPWSDGKGDQEKYRDSLSL